MFEVGTVRDELRDAVKTIDAEQYSGADATTMMNTFAEIERLGAAGKAMFAKRAAQANAHTAAGFNNPANWIAGTLGITPAEATDTLGIGEAMENVSEIGDAVRNGELSETQAAAVAKGAEVDPAVGKKLLKDAQEKTKTARELQEEAKKAHAQMRSDEEVRKRRFGRFSPQETGGVMLIALYDTVIASQMKAVAQARADELFNIARKEGRHEPPAAYISDAIAELILGDATAKVSEGKGVAHLRVDVTALKRGNAEPGEICEIPGVGPISVKTARELMDECILKAFITDGVDVLTVTSLSRYVPDAVDVALKERDQTCVVPGCDKTARLENDHYNIDFGLLGPTEYKNLAKLCRYHHRLKTHRGFMIERIDGKWVWTPPDTPKKPKRKKKKKPRSQRALFEDPG